VEIERERELNFYGVIGEFSKVSDNRIPEERSCNSKELSVESASKLI